MSSRLMKKVLNEQSAPLQLHSDGDDDDSESPQSSAPARNLFSLLGDDDDDTAVDQVYSSISPLLLNNIDSSQFNYVLDEFVVYMCMRSIFLGDSDYN